MQLNQDSAQKRIADLGIDDMPLVALRPTTATVAPDWFGTYRHACRKFMESLSDSIEELAMLNLTQDAFMALLMGQRLPANMSIRLRVPLTWGGRPTPENMFMCATFPTSHNLDRFIIEQSGNDVIWMPNPAKKIYVSVHTASGGDGGNATSDRLSQIAAQIVAGRSGME